MLECVEMDERMSSECEECITVARGKSPVIIYYFQKYYVATFVYLRHLDITKKSNCQHGATP